MLSGKKGEKNTKHPESLPNVVVLHAKAAVASKLISIVEIVKREAERRGESWFQYTVVEGVTQEFSRDKKAVDDHVGEVNKAIGQKEGRRDEDRPGNDGGGSDVEIVQMDGTPLHEGITVEDGEADVPMGDKAGHEEKEEDDEDSFETMKTPFERVIEGTVKVRLMPIIVVYLSTVPIESLRKKYG